MREGGTTETAGGGGTHVAGDIWSQPGISYGDADLTAHHQALDNLVKKHEEVRRHIERRPINMRVDTHHPSATESGRKAGKNYLRHHDYHNRYALNTSTFDMGPWVG